MPDTSRKHQGVNPQNSDAKGQAPFTHRNPNRISQPPVDHLDEEEFNQTRKQDYSYDTDFSANKARFSTSSYTKSRHEAEKLKKETPYGQYLSVPKGTHDLFAPSKKQSGSHIIGLLSVLVIILAILVIILCVLLLTR